MWWTSKSTQLSTRDSNKLFKKNNNKIEAGASKNKDIALAILEAHKKAKEEESREEEPKEEGTPKIGEETEHNAEARKDKSDILKLANNNSTIGSDFDIKTAASLLPDIDDKDETVICFIQGLELYDSMLNSAGKLQLINYALKVKILTGAARLKLKDTYATIADLVADIK